MPDQIAYDLDSAKRIKLIDQGDGSYALAVSDVGGGGGGTASQIEGTQPAGSVELVNPVVGATYSNEDGSIKALTSDEVGSLNVALTNIPLVETFPRLRGLSINNSGGTITSPNTSQQVLAANTNGTRAQITFQNASDTDMYIRFDGVATFGALSLKIIPGDIWEMGPQFVCAASLSVICSAAGKAFVCWEFLG